MRSGYRRTAGVCGFLVGLWAGMLGVPSAPAAGCLDVVLLLDQSGSMRQNDPQRLLVAAATDFVGRLAPGDAAGLVLFGARAKAAFPLTPLSHPSARTALLQEIRRIRYDDPRTNFATGIERGIYELREHGRADATPILVFITDGIMDSGSPARDAEMREWLRTRLLPDARTRGARIFSVALTEQADYALIQEMATATGGDYYRALGVTEIGGIFERISEKLRSRSAPGAVRSGGLPVVPVSVPPVSPPALMATGSWAALAAAFTLLLAGGAIMAGRSRRTRAAGRGGKGGEVTQLGRAATIGSPSEASLRDMRTGRAIRLVGPLVRVGRAPDNDVVLAESQVSGHHAEIECRQGRYVLRDLRSTNGTSVNRRPVSGETLLTSGDVIGFDEASFSFTQAEPVLAGTVLRDLREVIPRGPGPPPAPVPEPPASSGTVLMGTESTVDDSAGSAHCPRHPTFEATERCDVCGKFWCALCNPPVKGERACRHCRESRKAVAGGAGGGGPVAAG